MKWFTYLLYFTYSIPISAFAHDFQAQPRSLMATHLKFKEQLCACLELTQLNLVSDVSVGQNKLLAQEIQQVIAWNPLLGTE